MCLFFKELQENGDWHPICNFSPAKEIPKSLNQNGRRNDKIRQPRKWNLQWWLYHCGASGLHCCNSYHHRGGFAFFLAILPDVPIECCRFQGCESAETHTIGS